MFKQCEEALRKAESIEMFRRGVSSNQIADFKLWSTKRINNWKICQRLIRKKRFKIKTNSESESETSSESS